MSRWGGRGVLEEFLGGDVPLGPWNLYPGTYTRASSAEFCYPILDPNALIYIPYATVNCLKTIPFTAANALPPPAPHLLAE